MTNELKTYRITLEVPCEECKCTGEAYGQTCSDCDGTGYFEEKLTLARLKNLLEGGSL